MRSTLVARVSSSDHGVATASNKVAGNSDLNSSRLHLEIARGSSFQWILEEFQNSGTSFRGDDEEKPATNSTTNNRKDARRGNGVTEISREELLVVLSS